MLNVWPRLAVVNIAYFRSMMWAELRCEICGQITNKAAHLGNRQVGLMDSVVAPGSTLNGLKVKGRTGDIVAAGARF